MSYLIFKNYGTVREEMLGEFSGITEAWEFAQREANRSHWDDLIEVADYDPAGQYRVHRDCFGVIRDNKTECPEEIWEY